MAAIETWANENEVVSLTAFNCLGPCRTEALIVWAVIFSACWCFEIWMRCNDPCWWYAVILIESLTYALARPCSYVH